MVASPAMAPPVTATGEPPSVYVAAVEVSPVEMVSLTPGWRIVSSFVRIHSLDLRGAS